MVRDWVRWHEDYDNPDSSLSRRLDVVREHLRGALAGGARSLLSICAGDGRDVLPLLASQPGGRSVRALLIELDAELSGRARQAAAELDLPLAEVRTADAGATATYAGGAVTDAGVTATSARVEPVDVLLACGVFGNIPDADMRRTVAALPALTNPGATVIWTRGRGDGGTDPSAEVRARFRAEGFTEVAFVAPHDARFRVGVARRSGGGPADLPTVPRLFSFD
ncbi:SAM-dependent methyltransferase [Actinoplanes sp. CA-142083]|uniref:SAM-dependent methyltransferase n=1 Tax=Actinoplanes sp. CA-142083 TaxID=3239903 RepID=UPI003D938EBD